MKNLEEIKQIENIQERESACIDLFNQAMETQDTDIAIAVTEYVLAEGEICQTTFSNGWLYHCLRWLTLYWNSVWANSTDDSEEESHAIRSLMDCLWRYKWVVGALPQDLSVDKEILTLSLEEMAKLYDTFQISQAMVHKAVFEQAMYMGNKEIAQAAFAQWQAADKDDMNDCDACEQASLVRYYHFIGDYARAIESAQPILSGDLSCKEVPHISYYPVIDSLIQLGDMAKAEEILEEAINTITEENEKFIYLLPQLLQMYHHLGQPETVIILLNEWSEVIETSMHHYSYYFMQYILSIVPLDKNALAIAQNLAHDFDQRNHNQYYTNQLALMFISPVVH